MANTKPTKVTKETAKKPSTKKTSDKKYKGPMPGTGSIGLRVDYRK